jgi:hypothetical protein
MIAKATLIVALVEAGYLAVLLPLLLKALLRGRASVRRSSESAAVRPVIREALLDFMAGNPDTGRLSEFARSHRADLVECVLEFRDTVGGSARERFWEWALEVSLVHDWCQDVRSRDQRVRAKAFERLACACVFEPCRRVAGELQLSGIEDPYPDVRLAAASGLALSDDLMDAERVFGFATDENLMARILLAEPLRKHAIKLCERAVPEALCSRNEGRVLAALEMVIAWGRAVPLRGLDHLIEEGNRRVCILALRALPLVTGPQSTRNAVVRALSHEDQEIARAAIMAVGQMRIEEARAALQRCVQWGVPDVARAASEALAILAQDSIERPVWA